MRVPGVDDISTVRLLLHEGAGSARIDASIGWLYILMRVPGLYDASQHACEHYMGVVIYMHSCMHCRETAGPAYLPMYLPILGHLWSCTRLVVTACACNTGGVHKGVSTRVANTLGNRVGEGGQPGSQDNADVSAQGVQNNGWKGKAPFACLRPASLLPDAC